MAYQDLRQRKFTVHTRPQKRENDSHELTAYASFAHLTISLLLFMILLSICDDTLASCYRWQSFLSLFFSLVLFLMSWNAISAFRFLLDELIRLYLRRLMSFAWMDG